MYGYSNLMGKSFALLDFRTNRAEKSPLGLFPVGLALPRRESRRRGDSRGALNLLDILDFSKNTAVTYFTTTILMQTLGRM
jgi:hypothetical protein